MTKEELEKEAEKFLGGWLIDPEIVKLLVDFAEPREKKIESLGKRCLQLQKDKGELIDKTRELERKIASIRGSHRVDLAKLNARIEQVERLKKQLVEKGQLLDLTEREWAKDMSKMIHYKTQSTKAKEIINKLIELVEFLNEDNVKEPIIAEAEQFLKEE
jgi:hypothetical protein